MGRAMTRNRSLKHGPKSENASSAGFGVAPSTPATKHGPTPSQPPMLALHGPVAHWPDRAQHLHHFHQAQPLDHGVDRRFIAHRWLKRHTRCARKHCLCVVGTVRSCFGLGIGVIREIHRAVPTCRTKRSIRATHPCPVRRGAFSAAREYRPSRAFAWHRSRTGRATGMATRRRSGRSRTGQRAVTGHEAYWPQVFGISSQNCLPLNWRKAKCGLLESKP